MLYNKDPPKLISSIKSSNITCMISLRLENKSWLLNMILMLNSMMENVMN